MPDAQVVYICEQCHRARGGRKVDFPSGGSMWMCKRCEQQFSLGHGD